MYIEDVINQDDMVKLDLRRHFGVPLQKVSTSTLVSFFKTLRNRDENKLRKWNEEIESKWFVSTLYCYLSKGNEEMKNGSILFQDCLRDIYNGSDDGPIRHHIELLFNLDFRPSGRLEQQLKKIILMHKDKFAHIDYNALQYDLQNWNNSAFNSPKNKWAQRIVIYSPDNEEN